MALTAFKVMSGAAAIWSLLMIAASQRDAAPPAAATTSVADDEPQRSTAKADRLPLFVPAVAPLVDMAEPAIPRTERRREHRRRDVCEHGRRYYRIGHRRYWRCRRG
ncbi:hypothetical protein AAFX91_30095 [Bradyrhizobium sp. 31Argb]|uniref:hypothetical protein n=1 Tax=Bradyrhizobium TaxID=374 RepID=UPI000405A166|nr:hypothetical protein [Bradyrhizobium elkanii]